jgi:hypothetical protein
MPQPIARPTMPTYGREADARLADTIDQFGRAVGVTGAATAGALNVRDALDRQGQGGPPTGSMMRLGGPTDFDAALAQLQGILVDLDGDGQPDAQIPSNMIPQEQPNALQAAGGGQVEPQANALSPGFPDMVANNPRGWGNSPPADEAQLRSADPMAFNPVLRGALEYGSMPAKGFVEQIDRNANALSDATDDPSLANVTNAGAQTALTFGRPVAGAAIFGAGMLEAARRDFAPEIIPSADAVTLKNSQKRQMEMERMRLQAQAEADSLRMEAETKAQGKRAEDAARIAAEAERKQKEQDEYNRAVDRSEEAFTSEMGRVRRFSDSKSYTKEVSDAVGGAAPFLGGMIGGKAARVAGRGLMGQMIGGAAGGIGATSAPLFEDAYFTDIDNPERSAYMRRGAELPPGHPRKEEFLEHGRSLPEENPVRKHATEALYNPVRLGLSAAEGGLAGMMGGDLLEGLGRGARWLRGGRNALQPGGGPSTPSPAPAPEPRVLVRETDRLGRPVLRDTKTGHYAGKPEK